MHRLSPTDVSLIIGGITIVSSWLGAAFIAGVGWGKVKTELRDVTRRLSVIEGMFKLTLKDD